MNDNKIVEFVLHDFNNTRSLEEIEELDEKNHFSMLLIKQFKQT